MMEAMKMNDAAKSLFDKQNRTTTLLSLAGWVCLALGVILCSFGLWKQFRSAGGPLIATYRDGTVYVEASYGREAKIPSGAELRASLLTPESDPDAYTQKMAAFMSAIGGDGETARTNVLYKVGFYVGDQEIEPAAPVNVVIQVLQDGFAVGQPIKVVHLGENDAKVIADTSVDDAGFVSFTTDAFSPFAFVFDNGADQSGTTGTEDSSGTAGTEGSNGIVGNGRSWLGIVMQGGGFEEPSFDGAMTIANGPPIDLNLLDNDQVDLTFQYMDNGTWKTLPDGKSIFDYYNTNISINFQFNRTFTQDELQDAGGKLTYQLPPYLKDFSAGQSGELRDQNGTVVGTVTVGEDGKITIQLTDDFIKNNSSAKELHFTLSGQVDLDKADKGDEGDTKYPGFELELPTDEGQAHSQYGTLKLEKQCVSSEPKRDAEGNWYLDYTLTVTAPDFDMPDVSVEDVFDLDSTNSDVKARLQDLIDSYILYSVGNDSLNNKVGNEEPYPKSNNSVYQTDENGVPQLNWYLGDMAKEESRTLYYRVRLNKNKMESTDFTKDGTILPNDAEAFSRTYSKDDAHDELKIETYVYVEKKTQDNAETKGKFIPDGEGGGYFEYRVEVQNRKNYPVQVKVYDSIDDPNTNTTNSRDTEGLSYVKESFQFYDSNGALLDPRPDNYTIDFTEKDKDGAKHTSFTAHLGWLKPGDTVIFTYRIHVDAETLATRPVDVNNGIISLLESQQKNEQDSFSHWMERFQQQNRVEQEHWADKNYGGPVKAGTIEIPAGDTVYDATNGTVKESDNPGSFKIGENSFVYTVTVNGNTVWDVSSAKMGDRLSDGLHYSGYVQVVAKDKDGKKITTVWVKVENLDGFSFTGEDLGLDLGPGTSYDLTYYTTIDENYQNAYIVMENDFTLEGDIQGAGKTIHVGVKDSTNSRGETSTYREVAKDAWYYDPDENGLGAFYWVVKVDASYIPNGYALRDAAGDNHKLDESSLLGVYTGKNYTFDETLTWDVFQNSARTNGFTKFEEGKQYSKQFDANNDLTVTFGEDYTPTEDAPYVYLFFKTYVTERQAEPYENSVYSNEGNIPEPTVDTFQDSATNNLPDVGDVEKAGMQVFDWNGSKITFLNGADSTDYHLDANNLNGCPAGRYAAWSVSVNKTGTMHGDYTITDQIPEDMELSFVAIAKTVNILQPNTYNTPPWAIPLSDNGSGKSGLRVGHANQDAYTTGGSYRSQWEKSAAWQPWTADYWKYYPSADGRTVSWGVHIENGMCTHKDTGDAIAAYEVDYLVVCRVTDPDVLLGVTEGEPQKTFTNHVLVKDSKDTPVDSADAQLTVPCKPVVTKNGVQVQTNGYLTQTIKFTLTVNEEKMMVEGVGEKLTLKDKMSENLVLVQDSVKFYSDPACTQEITEGVGSTPPLEDNVITFTIPNGQAVYIQYECLINAPVNTQVNAENTVYFDGRTPDEQSETWKQTVSYAPGGGISGEKKMQIVKANPFGNYLSGAEFDVTLLGTTDENGVFQKNKGATQKFTTGANGYSEAFEPTEGGLYEIVETKAPEGYVPDRTPRYYWIGKGSLSAPSAEDAGLPSGTTINARYTGVIDVPITNERAKITVTKKFVNADGEEMSSGVRGTYTFGLFTKDGDTYKEATAAYGPREQTLTYPGDLGKALTFYVPYDTGEYYILELDKEGNPMEAGSKAWVQTDGEEQFEFEPRYDYNSGTGRDGASSSDAVTEVTVTNICYAAYLLPESGGPGTLVTLLTGLALTLGSGIILTAKKRRRVQ